MNYRTQEKNKEYIEKLLIKAGYSQIPELKCLHGGYANLVWGFCEDGQKKVIKCAIPNEKKNDKISSVRLEIEAYEMFSHNPTVFCPKVYYSNVDKSGSEFFIMDFIQGVHPSMFFPGKKTSDEAVDQLGHMMAEIHNASVKTDACGFRGAITGDNWYEAVINAVNYADSLTGRKRLSLKLLRKYVVKHQNILRKADTTFVHGDLWSNNLIVDENGRLEVFDFESAMVGDPIIDFTMVDPLHGMKKKQRLLQAYNRYAKKPLPAQWSPAIEFRYLVGQAYHSLMNTVFVKTTDGISLWQRYQYKKWENHYMHTVLNGMLRISRRLVNN